MKRITTLSIVCSWLLFAASTGFAQMYTVTDLGTLGGSWSLAYGINASGQVVGASATTGDPDIYHAFRTAPNSPINPTSDDLGTLGGSWSRAFGINASGQVVGDASIDDTFYHAFRTAPNSPINPATDDLGAFAANFSGATGINTAGQVVGFSYIDFTFYFTHAFRTAPNSRINVATDDLGTLGGRSSFASGITDTGQVVGEADILDGSTHHAFRTAANKAVNPATDDLGTLGGDRSTAYGINAYGQVVGQSDWSFVEGTHAFRTAPNSPINVTTDDLGTLGGIWTSAGGINDYGEVVGESSTTFNDVGPEDAFIHSSGAMQDLNNLIPAASGWTLTYASSINNAGQIVGSGINPSGASHAFLLTPIYNAFVHRPINADGSSVFSAKRGVIPVKFTVTEYNSPSCALPATIAITRATSDGLTSVDESIYATKADNGSNFRIAGCQYVYNLAASSMGVGTYRVDISIQEIMVGHAVFALR